jgi:hypothetical protein
LSSAAAKTTFHFWPLTVVGLLAVGNAISSSRTGLVQLLLVCGMYVTWNGLGNLGIRRLLSCAVLVYVLAALAMPHIAGLDLSTHGTFARFGQDDGCASRLTLWANVLTLIAQKPWLGWGWGELDYAHYITLYPGARFCDILSNAHNLPLHLAVELGVPVALMVCGVAVWLVLRARPWRETDATRQLAWGVLALILLHSMLEYPLWYGPFQMAFGLCVYLLWATRTRSARAVQLAAYPGPAAASRSYLQLSVRPDDVSIPVRPELVERFLFHRAGSMALVAMLMLATALAAWDYHRVSQLYLTPAQRAGAYREDTLEKTRGTWFFKQQFDFALLGLTPLTPENALQIHTLSHRLLHFSPEPRVIEKVIESAVMLGRDDEAMLHLARYRAAFAQEHVRWRSSVVLTEQPAK